ncbi:Uncharacterised protein [Mycobacteroides abscessus subsp. massiliense]|nr:Uncharacterised protein [Mycobacteroides abscessus subsp. massiliense]
MCGRGHLDRHSTLGHIDLLAAAPVQRGDGQLEPPSVRGEDLRHAVAIAGSGRQHRTDDDTCRGVRFHIPIEPHTHVVRNTG